VARRRFVAPEFWDDPKIQKGLTIPERIMLVGLFSKADDEARLIGEPDHLRSEIFKYDDLTLEQVREMRDHILATMNCLILYTHDGYDYLAFKRRNWRRWQNPSHPTPSTLPKPPLDSGYWDEDDDDEAIGNDSGEPLESFGNDSLVGKVGLGKVGLGRDRLDSGAEQKSTGEAKDRKVPDTPHHRIVDFYLRQISPGYEKRHKGKFQGDLKAIKAMLERGRTAEEIRACYLGLKSEPFWASKHLSVRKVDEDIDDWLKAKREGKSGPHREVPKGRRQEAGELDTDFFRNLE